MSASIHSTESSSSKDNHLAPMCSISSISLSKTHSKQDIQGKIKQFFCDISYTNNLPKHLKIKMTTLAQLLDETRLNISKTLHQMQANGEVAITREQITLLKQ